MLEFNWTWYKPNITTFFNQPSNPPIVVILFFNVKKFSYFKRHGTSLNWRIIINCSIISNIGPNCKSYRFTLSFKLFKIKFRLNIEHFLPSPFPIGLDHAVLFLVEAFLFHRQVTDRTRVENS